MVWFIYKENILWYLKRKKKVRDIYSKVIGYKFIFRLLLYIIIYNFIIKSYIGFNILNI